MLHSSMHRVFSKQIIPISYLSRPFHQSAGKMPPLVLALGIPDTSPSVPEHAREGLRKVLEAMHEDMRTSPHDYENLYVDTNRDFQVLIDKLREKRWDILHIGGERVWSK